MKSNPVESEVDGWPVNDVTHPLTWNPPLENHPGSRGE